MAATETSVIRKEYGFILLWNSVQDSEADQGTRKDSFCPSCQNRQGGEFATHYPLLLLSKHIKRISNLHLLEVVAEVAPLVCEAVAGEEFSVLGKINVP